MKSKVTHEAMADHERNSRLTEGFDTRDLKEAKALPDKLTA
jgi:hypothetical protein